ncbi:MAG: pantetheine-phosphate adenylyltransferase [Bifidobacteriaceae bacterium]|jgi:pantetheine-phosphate adenylyltransferase|nr:pantetheine-phosphate adenylyltransferase [Bifidobacteriaceae bacterium]
MSVAVFPGSFDPITLGHLDLIERARGLFDEVIVAVALQAGKNHLLGVEERIVLVERAVADLQGVRVMALPGLLVDFCKTVGASAIVKGLRSTADLLIEEPQAHMNRRLGLIETVFLVARPRFGYVSSTIVKQVAAAGGVINDYVTDGVSEAVTEALARRTDSEN